MKKWLSNLLQLMKNPYTYKNQNVVDKEVDVKNIKDMSDTLEFLKQIGKILETDHERP